MKIRAKLITVLSIGIALASCESDDPVIPNQEEVITNVNYTLTPENGETPIILSFTDLDGDGGNPPTIAASGALSANTIYTGALELLNKQGDDIDNITEEIAEEDDEHQFFITSSISDLTVEYADVDENKLPVGLRTKITANETGSGTLKLVLLHMPNKTAEGVAEGNIANAGGETDIEITFNIEVQ